MSDVHFASLLAAAELQREEPLVNKGKHSLSRQRQTTKISHFCTSFLALDIDGEEDNQNLLPLRQQQVERR